MDKNTGVLMNIKREILKGFYFQAIRRDIQKIIGELGRRQT